MIYIAKSRYKTASTCFAFLLVLGCSGNWESTEYLRYVQWISSTRLASVRVKYLARTPAFPPGANLERKDYKYNLTFFDVDGSNIIEGASYDIPSGTHSVSDFQFAGKTFLVGFAASGVAAHHYDGSLSKSLPGSKRTPILSTEGNYVVYPEDSLRYYLSQETTPEKLSHNVESYPIYHESKDLYVDNNFLDYLVDGSVTKFFAYIDDSHATHSLYQFILRFNGHMHILDSLFAGNTIPSDTVPSPVLRQWGETDTSSVNLPKGRYFPSPDFTHFAWSKWGSIHIFDRQGNETIAIKSD